MEICNRSAENSRCVDQTSRLEVVEARKRKIQGSMVRKIFSLKHPEIP